MLRSAPICELDCRLEDYRFGIFTAEEHHVVNREIQDRYASDASGYDAAHKRKARRIYDLIPSNMESKKKRVVVQRIEGRKGSTFADYEDEFASP